MLTFEELKPVLFGVAHRYSRQYPRFEFWELVNQLWASKRIQTIHDIRLAKKAAQWAMIDYIRETFGREGRKNMQQFPDDIEDSKNDSLACDDHRFDEIEWRDYRKYKSRHLSGQKRKFFLLMCRGLKKTEIANRIGLGRPAVTMGFQSMRKEFEDLKIA